MAPRKTEKADKSPKKVKKTDSKKKDPSAPKKNLSAYMFFSMKRYQEVVKECPDMKSKVAEVAKTIGAEWRLLQDQQRAPYVVQAVEDKKRYESEMEKFKQASQAA